MIRKPHSIPSALALACAVSLLAACGGGGGSGGSGGGRGPGDDDGDKGKPAVTYTLSGTITRLNGSAVLQNAGDSVSVSGDGSFTFPTPVVEGEDYDAQVHSLQCANQTCLVASGSAPVMADG